MAKAKTGSESKIGLILTLIFFILTTLILGVLFYLSQEEIENALNQAKQAKDREQTALKDANEWRTLAQLNRVIMGSDDEEDIRSLQGNLRSNSAAVNREFSRIKARFAGDNPNAVNFPDPQNQNPGETIQEWVDQLPDLNENQLANSAQDRKTMVFLLNLADNKVAAAEKLQQDAEAASAAALAEQQNIQKAKDDADAAHRAALDKVQKDLLAEKQAKEEAFKKAQADLDRAGQNLEAERTRLNRAKRDVDRELNDVRKELAKKEENLSHLRSRVEPPTVDFNKPHGAVARRRDKQVYINIGSRSGLRSGIAFSIFSAQRSAVPEEILLTASGAVVIDGNLARSSRIPPGLKGAVEVQQILGPDTALCRIIYEADQVRDPINEGDQLYNPAWKPGMRERIAFAGIIDLNGDGRDNNEEFLRLLERHGVIVDGYLDLQSRTIKGDGVTLDTAYLIVSEPPDFRELDRRPDAGDDDPRVQFKKEVVDKMGEMQTKARELGVQTMSARRFLAYMGIEVPRGVQSPGFGSADYLRPQYAPEKPQGGNGAGAGLPLGR